VYPTPLLPPLFRANTHVVPRVYTLAVKPPILTLVALLFLPSLPLVCGGCASTPAHDEAAAEDAPPSDFTLAMTVMAQVNRRNTATIPRDRRPARFVIETDWVLRAYTGRGPIDTETFPRETRQLNAAQIQSLWTDLRAAGLLDPANPAIAGKPPVPADITQNKPLWVVTFTADADRRTLVIDADRDGPAAPLLNRLADLAWMPK
jgi:hypothetical protein